jgi:hypothetical protein
MIELDRKFSIKPSTGKFALFGSEGALFSRDLKSMIWDEAELLKNS